MRLSIIIPVYNESSNLEQLTSQISRLEANGHEVIVVDGGSQDATFDGLARVCKTVLRSAKGRAAQMNTGARHASGDVLVFLHADTILPDHAETLIEAGIQQRPWGRFNVAFSSKRNVFALIGFMMNLRSCITGIATGDLCMFIKRDLFERLGGYAEIPLMEDVELSQRLKKLSRPFCISAKVITSSRRWEEKGIIQTVFLMWSLRLAYFFGVSPQRLHKHYYS